LPPKFKKFPLPPLFLFDGFDPKTVYQMVPVRDKREMGVITDSSDCLLRIEDPAVASMANFRSSFGPLPTPSLTVDQFQLPKNSRVAFSILGKSVGHTELHLEEQNGAVQDLLLVSVKNKVTKQFSLCFLSDSLRSTTRPKADAVAIMGPVASVYLNQANLELKLLGQPTDVSVARNLGNPIRPSTPGVVRDIISATPGSLFRGDVVIYCCWDVEDSRTLGVTRGQVCFVEDGGAPTDFEVRFVFGHEVGHALGLDHNGSFDHLMFATTASRSSKLSQFEIDTINQTGLV